MNSKAIAIITAVIYACFVQSEAFRLKGKLRQGEEEMPVKYESAVKQTEEVPIRVAYDKVRLPVRVSSGGYEGSLSEKEEELLRREMDENAHYSFASAVDDGIMDHSHIRQEKREGLKVTGTFAYSDGFFKRIVQYEADDDGYRVVKEEVEPISETGPQIDLQNGKAEVRTQIGGVDTHYSVHAEEIGALKSKV